MTTDLYDGWLWQGPLETTEELVTLATQLPCPSWCTLPDGHGFEDLAPPARRLAAVPDDGGDASDRRLLRVHQQRFGSRPTHVALEAVERATSPTGPTDLGLEPSGPLVRVQFPHASGYLTRAGARRLAALLLEAAEAVEGDAQ